MRSTFMQKISYIIIGLLVALPTIIFMHARWPVSPSVCSTPGKPAIYSWQVATVQAFYATDCTVILTGIPQQQKTKPPWSRQMSTLTIHLSHAQIRVDNPIKDYEWRYASGTGSAIILSLLYLGTRITATSS